MGQVSECLIGLTYSPFDVRVFGTLVLRSSNVQNGRLAFDDNVFVDMEVPARTITRKNDILICVRNGSRQLIGKCALIDDTTAGSAFGAFMSVLRSDSAKFLFYQFQSNRQKRQIDEVMGATINQITNKDMAAFKVIWPPTKSEQTAIAEMLSDMDAELAALEARRDKTRALKQGMMQELLTGRTRLV
jgi:type I restriction enzyme S subunit